LDAAQETSNQTTPKETVNKAIFFTSTIFQSIRPIESSGISSKIIRKNKEIVLTLIVFVMLLPNEPDALRGRAGHAFASMAGLFLTRKALAGAAKKTGHLREC
jgi:hypothetical protein